MFGHVADEGWMDGCAGDLLRYRRSIGADHIAVLVDVKKKHWSLFFPGSNSENFELI